MSDQENATNPPQYSIDVFLGKLIQLWDSYCDEQSHLEQYPDIDSFLRHSKVEPTKQAINQLIYTQVLELIGEDEKYPKLTPNSGMYNPTMITRNQIRQELRKALKAKYIGESEGDNLMSKAQNALNILKKNLGYQDMLDLIELISAYLEEDSQKFIKVGKEND
ncbi:MAG TPA: hypothetical protein VMR76_01410 [Candidatus Saccharimonadia bacterium]|nr:hypothetical protein [Candidatus Saccharimonadia bacterium]